jgi:hypothetical protein
MGSEILKVLSGRWLVWGAWPSFLAFFPAVKIGHERPVATGRYVAD